MSCAGASFTTLAMVIVFMLVMHLNERRRKRQENVLRDRKLAEWQRRERMLADACHGGGLR